MNMTGRGNREHRCHWEVKIHFGESGEMVACCTSEDEVRQCVRAFVEDAGNKVEAIYVSYVMDVTNQYWRSDAERVQPKEG